MRNKLHRSYRHGNCVSTSLSHTALVEIMPVCLTDHRLEMTKLQHQKLLERHQAQPMVLVQSDLIFSRRCQ
ncbi:hypothetical protein RRG08_038423 [Elysia crispata]|uniref:Uncharacterized protein n=1 Tax=Elysia crispata TaxID=231223 RepID=A0AAE1AM61_9GAST|nr:hypothetical protein RRG08_038423 [Elysia crispata]